MLKEYDQTVHPAGEYLPEPVRVYRVKVLTDFLKAGVAIEKIDMLRDILEENSLRLTCSQRMRELIPFILLQEEKKLLGEINKKHVSVIFDGTTHVCEAMVIVLRYLDDTWCLQQRVAKLRLLAKSMTGEELARELIVTLSTELAIKSDKVVATMRDRAAVNNVAIQTLKIVFPKVFDIGCFSHTLDHVGEKFKTPILDSFSKSWLSMFSRSPKTRLA